jgi:hypothetical protein
VLSPGTGLDFCIVVREMETWLLADEEAISSVALSRGGREVPRVPSALEDLMDAKEHLMRLLSRALLPYDPELCRQIASQADLDRLRYRCPSFRRFEGKVLDC